MIKSFVKGSTTAQQLLDRQAGEDNLNSGQAYPVNSMASRAHPAKDLKETESLSEINLALPGEQTRAGSSNSGHQSKQEVTEIFTLC